MNGTLRELEARVRAYRARTGRDLDALWISHERWQLLPEPFRLAAMRARFNKETSSAALIDGVPLYLIQLVDTAGRPINP